MAGRKAGFRHSEKTREKIRATQLVNRLQAYVLGENDPQTGKPVEMKPAQVNAAKVLLDKKLPTLTMSDVLNSSSEEQDPKEVFQKLCDMMGKDAVLSAFPAFKDFDGQQH